jgi:hypothetical protein
MLFLRCHSSFSFWFRSGSIPFMSQLFQLLPSFLS